MRIQLNDETDLVNCRQRARQIASLIRLDSLQQTQFATAVSEIARNALRYAGSGKVIFSLENEVPRALIVVVEDEGPGIARVDKAIASAQGMGLKASFRLMDICEIHSTVAKGTKVRLGKYLGHSATLTHDEIKHVIDRLIEMRPGDAIAEIKLQNTELLVSLEELKKQQDTLVGYQRQLEELNKELADTNRGVIALNIELEEQAKTVRDASEIKARFLSHVTHEFRTPVNSILSMSRILLNTSDNLSEDQLKQVGFMRRAAEGLSDMVNDLLDTVKADAGKWEVVNAPVSISDVFDTLKAMFKPLLPTDRALELVFVDDGKVPSFIADETKISQILRNFISNAVKFTEAGRVDVSAQLISPDILEIIVQDSGIGIAPEDQKKIFEEFMQVNGPHQKRAKGTGLGLPLARKLARLLEGEVFVKSDFGKGAAFSLRLPFHPSEIDSSPGLAPTGLAASTEPPRKVLIIDDDESSHYAIRDALSEIGCDFAFALNGSDGLALAGSFKPDLIILDVRMPGMDGFEALKFLKERADTRDIPVLLNSSMRFSIEDFPAPGPRPAGILLKDDAGRKASLRQIKKALRGERNGGQDV